MEYIKGKKQGAVYFPKKSSEFDIGTSNLRFTGEDYVDATFKDPSGSFVSILSLSKDWVYVTVTTDVESVVIKAVIKKVETVSNGYELTDFDGNWVSICRDVFTDELKIKSRYSFVSFHCSRDILLKLFSKLGDWWD